MDTMVKLLQKVHLFKDLTDEEIQPIVNISIKRQYRDKAILFLQGDPLDRVFFIVSGKVKIYKTDLSGKEQIVSVLQAEDMFPHAGFFRQGSYPAHAETLEDTTLMVIPIADFEKMLIQNPKLCIKLFRVMGERMVDLQNRLEEQVLHDTYEQIIMLLVRLGKTHGTETAGPYFKLNTKFTNRELANMIGSSRETINRTLTQLKKKKLIDLHEDGSLLLDINKLEELLN